MHDALLTGMGTSGVFRGDPVPFFREGIPHVDYAPPFKLKNMDDAVITYGE